MRWIAALLLIGGLAIMVFGIGGALWQLGQTYKHAIDEPMVTHVEDEGGALRDRMLVFVAIGSLGVVPAAVGGAMLKIGLIRRLMRGKPTASGRAGHTMPVRKRPPDARGD
jgi:hypothetical protein